MMMKALMVAALFGAAAAPAGDCADPTAVANADPDASPADACTRYSSFTARLTASVTSPPARAASHRPRHQPMAMSMCVSPRVCRPRFLDWLLRAGDTCVGAAVATWTASGSTDQSDRADAVAGCLPDPVMGSCDVVTTAECTACYAIVVARDTALAGGGDDDAINAAVAAACGTPLTTVVAGSCADFDALAAADVTNSLTPTACTSVTPPPPETRAASRRRRHPSDVCLTRVCPRRPRLKWLLRAGDTCVRIAGDIYAASGSTEVNLLPTGCYPDRVVGSCAGVQQVGSESAECLACRTIVEYRDPTIINEDFSPAATYYPTVNAACGTPDPEPEPDPVPDTVPDTPAKPSGAGVVAPMAALIAVVAMQ